jgi:hypothetical protein
VVFFKFFINSLKVSRDFPSLTSTPYVDFFQPMVLKRFPLPIQISPLLILESTVKPLILLHL